MSFAKKRVIPTEIADEEYFTRFIVSRNYFSAEKGRVKPQALTPAFNGKRNRWETSTHRIRGLTVNNVWRLGYSNVEVNDRRVKARATGPFAIVTAQRLGLDVNGPPYPWHVDIVGWSMADKHARLMQATEIADKLELELDPRG